MIRVWSNTFNDLGVHNYPSCMNGIAHQSPLEILKALKLNCSDARKRFIATRVDAHKLKKAASCAWTARKGLLLSKHSAPKCFNPFNATHYTERGDISPSYLTADEVWSLLTEDQRLSLLVDEAMLQYDRTTQVQTGRAEREWWDRSMRAVRGGSEAVRNNARHTPSKKRLIDEHFARAQQNIN